MKIKLFVLLLSLLFVFPKLKAQKDPLKFGKFSDEELEMTVYAKDTTAAAVVLGDYHTVRLDYVQDRGFIQNVRRHIRIKILKKEGYDWARKNIELYKGIDKLGELKGLTVNNENGSVEKIKLSKKLTYTENINENWEQVKFEMPGVQVGSIIDIEYTIISESYWIDEHYFQWEIPVVSSEFHVFIPEYFHYKQLEKGYLPLSERSTETIPRNISMMETTRTGTRVVQANSSSYTVRYQENYYFFKAVDFPAFKVEEHIDCEENYMSCVDFELGSTKFPNAALKNYSTTWPALAQKLDERSGFGGAIQGKLFMREELKQIPEDATAEEKVVAAVNLIRGHITWDKRKGIYEDNASKAWKEGSGNVGDINLTLVSALRSLDLEAYPVILSTRNHGMVHPAQIILKQYNYVVAAVKLNDKYVYLDATEKNLPIGMLPERCINGTGRLIRKGGGQDMDLSTQIAYKTNYSANYHVNADGSIAGEVLERYSDYAALSKRNALQYYNNEEEFIEKYEEYCHMDIALDSICAQRNINEPLSVYYDFEAEGKTENIGDLLLIDPVLLEKKTRNPFQMESRSYPVDFSYPRSVSYMATVEVPEGYAIENLPETKRMVMPDRTASFLYSVQFTAGKIVIVSRFDIKKTVFLPDEYSALKTFYNQVIEAHDQKLVLKKTS